MNDATKEHGAIEQKRHNQAVVKRWEITLAVLVALSTSLTVADDFKTTDGKEYKDAKVSRVEPDGIVLRTKWGISKLYFTELPKEVQVGLTGSHLNIRHLAKHAGRAFNRKT